VPTLTAGMIVIIDNASFHKSSRIRNLIEQAGCLLIYLPPYSPDLNPIEHYWYKLKTMIRKMMRNAKITLFDAMDKVLKEISIC
jgi:transposase